ncbi:MAG: hypothetical protein AB7D51_08970 [Desulfovibrionaceae bacterium]
MGTTDATADGEARIEERIDIPTPERALELLAELGPSLRAPGHAKGSLAARVTASLLVFEGEYVDYEYRRPSWNPDPCRFRGFMCDSSAPFEERVAVQRPLRMVADLAALASVDPGEETTLALIGTDGSRTLIAATDRESLLRLAGAVTSLARAHGSDPALTR